MNRFKRIFRCICFLLIATIIFAVLTHIFERKTLTGAWNYTAKVNGYINAPADTIDVVCFGSSHMYCSVNPAVLEEYGISAYVLATRQQPVKASYYYMIEALKTQKPKVFLFETYMVNDTEEVSDTVISDAVDPLPLSVNKLRMIADLTQGKKARLPYFLTLFQYNSRWKELSTEDFTFCRKNVSDVHKGYVYLTDSKPVTKNLYDMPPVIEDIRSEDLEYLEKIIALCEENDIQLILLYAPFSMSEHDYNTCYTVEHFADTHQLDFINGYELMDSFDFNTDFYDPRHLNLSGSTKLTAYLGDYLLAHDYLQ